ncbi:hypothetical protein TNCV_3419481 [Trichonephila clavipes]|nr:hypothetical protein TNCV_3419481 [Trichonephila clavipes]
MSDDKKMSVTIRMKLLGAKGETSNVRISKRGRCTESCPEKGCSVSEEIEDTYFKTGQWSHPQEKRDLGCS